MKVYREKPQDIEKREPKEAAVYQLLENLAIPFERVDHQALFTIDACSAVEQVLGVSCCKNLFLCNGQKTKFYLLLMPGEKKFRTKDVSSQINSSRLSFADEMYMEEYLDITPGSVSVMGLMNDKENQVQLLIDKELLEEEYLGCHPCINTSSLKIHTSDVINKFLPAVFHEYITVEL
ncbi:MAG TPA: prolyl-tRNA synthetase associated domain-containing protein [Candidatus Pelethocola excrementipullorum]|nr:prolyl-tRNA synthetase associated domain-containing protein [Candidatus Pelethocola excrementipullorum]